MARLLALFILLLLEVPSNAQDAQQQRVDAAIASAQKICLVGSRYKFSMNVKGELTILKLQPGGEASVTVDAANATGGVLFEKEEIRQIVDADIRKCMGEQWPQVLRALEDKKSSILGPLGFPPENVDTAHVQAEYPLGKWQSDRYGAKFTYDGLLDGVTVGAEYRLPVVNGKFFSKVTIHAEKQWTQNVAGVTGDREATRRLCSTVFDILLKQVTDNVGAPISSPEQKWSTAKEAQDMCLGDKSCQESGGAHSIEWKFRTETLSISLYKYERQTYTKYETQKVDFEFCNMHLNFLWEAV